MQNLSDVVRHAEPERCNRPFFTLPETRLTLRAYRNILDSLSPYIGANPQTTTALHKTTISKNKIKHNSILTLDFFL